MIASVGVWTRPSETSPPTPARPRIAADPGRAGTRAGRGAFPPDEPVGLGPCPGRRLERLQLVAGAQLVEAAADRLLRHGADPEAVDRLRRVRARRRGAEDGLVEVRED